MSRPFFPCPEANEIKQIFPDISHHLNLDKTYKKRISQEKNSDSQSFQPEYHQIKKLGFKINKNKISIGGWGSQENRVYLQFMIDHFNDFLTQKERRKTKVFYRLSKILKKRTPDQCRSHHQKLQLKHGDDLYGIMSEVNRKIQTCMVQQYVDQQHKVYLEKFKNMENQPKTKIKSTQKEVKLAGNWFDLSLKGATLRIVIKQEEIGAW